MLESRTFTEGSDVIKQGDAGEEFFLVEAGSAVAVKLQDGQEVVVKQYNKGDYFGGTSIFTLYRLSVVDHVKSSRLKRTSWRWFCLGCS